MTAKIAAVRASAAQSFAVEPAVDFSPEALAALEAHPAFADVVRRLCAATVEGYRSRWILNRLLNDGGRVIASFMMIDLHFSAGKGRGFTLAQLKREAVEGGLCSAGRIAAFLMSLRCAGFLTTGPSEDGRTRLLVPTEALLTPHRDRWRVLFGLLAELRPEARGAAEALEDPAFLGHCAHVLMETYRSGHRILGYTPALTPIGERDAGLTMLMALLVLEPGRSMSITALAQCFSVSRSHVRETLRIAERDGLAREMEGRGRFGPGPHLEAVLGRFFSVLFRVYLHAFALAAEQGWTIGDSDKTPLPQKLYPDFA